MTKKERETEGIAAFSKKSIVVKKIFFVGM
jgi:hypothetical protein